MLFSTLQCVSIAEHHLWMQLYEAVKQTYDMQISDTAAPKKSTIFWFVNQVCHSCIFSTYILKRDELYLQPGVGTLSTYYVITYL
jgi:hypothetical protein